LASDEETWGLRPALIIDGDGARLNGWVCVDGQGGRVTGSAMNRPLLVGCSFETFTTKIKKVFNGTSL
jgi:hypothetical protein